MRWTFRFILGFTVILVLSTCELFDPGLGSKVDIEAPTISITDPNPQNIVFSNKAFTLSGKAADDIAVKKVLVNVPLASSTQVLEARLASDGSWTCPVDTTGMKEGESRIDAVAYDKRDQTASASITVQVDRTPPTVYVTSPIMYEPSIMTSSSLVVTGETWDRDRTERVYLDVLGAGDAVLCTVEAVGSSSWRATVEYGTVANSNLADGSYRFRIRAIDRSGNSSTSFFHIQDVLTALAANVSSSKVTVDLLGGIVTGSVAASSFPGTWSKVINHSVMAFQRNQNAPELTITIPQTNGLVGGDATTATGTAKTKGSTILKVLYALTDASILIAPAFDTEGAWNNASIIGSGTEVGWTAAVNMKDLAEGSYRLHAYAQDLAANNSAVQSVAFYYDNAAPALDVGGVTITPSYLNENYSFIIKASDSNGLQTLVITRSKKIDNETINEVIFSSVNNPSFQVGEDEWTYEYTEDIKDLEDNVEGYQYIITVYDVAGRDTPINRRVFVDTDPPIISFADPIPSLEPDSTSSGHRRVNGKITIKGNANDNIEIGKLLRVFINGDEVDDDEVGVLYDGFSINKYSFTVEGLNTDKYFTDSETGILTILVRAEDAAGNVAEETQTVWVDQSTDSPIITFTNLNSTILNESGVVNNLLETNPALLGTVSDDDSVDVGSLKISVDGGAWQMVSNPPPANTTQGSFRHDLSALDLGVHRLRMRVTDIGGKEVILPPLTSEDEDQYMYFAIDKDYPVVSFNGAGSALYVKADTTVAMTGSASDASGLKDNQIELRRGSTGVFGPVTVTGGLWSWTLSTTGLTSGTIEVAARATDIYNKTQTYTRTVTVDSEAPTISLNSISPIIDATYSGGTLSGGTVNGIIRLQGNVGDNYLLTGLQYKLGGSAEAETGAGYTAITLNPNWTVDIDTETVSEGAQNLYIRAIDAAGNVGLLTLALDVDQSTDRPTITFTSLDTTALASSDAARNLLVSGSTITGSIEDDDGLPSTATLYIDRNGDDDFNDASESVSLSLTGTGTVKNFTINPTNLGLAQGRHKFALSVQDDAASKRGKPAVSNEEMTPVWFAYDTEPPALNIETSTGGWYNGTFTIEGSSSDSYGLALVEVSSDNGSIYTNLNVAVSGDTDTGVKDWDFDAASMFTGLFGGAHEGSNKFLVRATDTFGRTTLKEFQFNVDTVVPTTPVIDAFNGIYVENELVASGTTGDTGGTSASGVALAEFSIDGGTWASLNGTDNWYKTIDISSYGEGGHTLYVQATDRAGNVSASGSRTFTIDRADPELTVALDGVDFTGGTKYADGTYNLAFTLTDSLELGSYTVTRNGSPIAGHNNVAISGETHPVTVSESGLSDGTYVYVINAKDAVGRGVSATRTVVVDRTPPVLGITNFTDNLLIEQTSYTARGDATEGAGESGVALVEYSIDSGATWPDATGTDSWNILLDPLAQTLIGSISFRATDNAGNVSTPITRSYRVDNALPTITALELDGAALISGVNYAGNTYDITFDLGDTLQLSSYTVTREGTALSGHDGVSLSGTGSSITVEESGLADGTYEYAITVYDAVGKNTSISRTVMVDTASPTLTITAPVENESVEGSSYTIRGTVDDGDGKGVVSIGYSTDSTNGTDGSWTAITKAFSWSQSGINFSTGGEGERTLWVRASDGLNPATAESVAFSYDLAPPTFMETEVNTTDTQYTNGTVSFGGIVWDTNTSGAVTVQVSLDGAAGTSTGITITGDTHTDTTEWEYDLDTASLTEGLHSLVFTATDAGYRTVSITRTVVADRTAPTMPVVDAFSGTYVTSSLVASGETGDPNPVSGPYASGVVLTEYRIGTSGEWPDLNGTNDWFGTIDLSNTVTYPEGTYTLYVQATDRAGNTSSAGGRDFTIDREDPEFASLTFDGASFAAGTKYTNGGAGNEFALAFTVTDSLELGHYTVTRNGSAITGHDNVAINGTSQTLTITETVGGAGLADGSYVYVINAQDEVGRSVSATRTVVVDTDAPDLDITNFADNLLIEQTSYTVRGTATEGAGESGVALVEYSLDGGATWPDATGTDSWNILLDPLAQTLTGSISFRATDNAGNESAPVTRSYRVDTASPTITALQLDGVALVSGVNYAGNTYDITFDLGDTLQLSSYTVTREGTALGSHDGVSLSGTGSAITVEESGLADGTYEYGITVYDAVGKNTTVSRTVMVDTASPTLIITAPVENESVEGSSYTIRGTVDDGDGKGVVSIGYSTNSTNGTDGSWTAITKAFSWSQSEINFSTDGEGNRTLWVRASDGLNPMTSESVAFSYDLAPPTFTETEVNTTDTQYTKGTVIFGGIVWDTNTSGAVTVQVSLDGAAATSTGITITGDTHTDTTSWDYDLDTTSLTEGLHSLVFTARDAGYRTVSITRTVVADRTAPTMPVVDAFSGTYVTSSLVASGETGDPNPISGPYASGVVLTEYRIGPSGGWTSLNGTNDWFGTIDLSNTVTYPEGTYTLYVQATDRAGNTSSAGSRNFTIDRGDPEFASITFDGASFAAGTKYTNGGTEDEFELAFTVTDSLELGHYTVTRNGSAITGHDNVAINGTSQALTVTETVGGAGLVDGTYVYVISAQDEVGRSVSATRTVVVDTDAPDLGITNFADNLLIEQTSYTARGTATEDAGESGVALVEYSLDGGATWPDATGTDSWNIVLDPLAQTLTGSIQFRATDNAGNESAPVIRSYRVDTASPTIPSVTLDGSAFGTAIQYKNGNFAIAFTASDTLELGSYTVTRNGTVITGHDSVSIDGTSQILTINEVVGSGVGELADDTYEYEITVVDEVGNDVILSRTLIVDTAVPTAEFTSLTPVVDVSTVNGIITVRAAVADETVLNTVYWTLLSEADTPETSDFTAIAAGSKFAPEFSINTTLASANVQVNGGAAADGYIADGEASRLWIRAVDNAGNSTDISRILSVSQASDNPAISFTGINTGADTAIESYLNLIESNAVLRFQITDDDMINAATIQIAVDGGAYGAINRNGGAVLTDAKSISTSHNLSSPTVINEGTHYFYLRVFDLTSAKLGLPAVSEEIGPVYFMVDRNFPVIATIDPEEATVYKSDVFTLSGTVTDTNALKSIKIDQIKDSDPESSTPVLPETTLTGTSDSWSVSNLPSGGASDGHYRYTITLTDASDKQTVLERVVIIDETDPLDPTVTDPVSDAWLKSGTYIFKGTASDGTGSGVETVYITETAQGAGAPAIGDPAWNSTTVNSSDEWTLPVEIDAPGLRDLHVYSVDGAGNVSSMVTHPFGLDQSAPSVSVTGGMNTLYDNGVFTIDGSFTETSGILSIGVETSTDNLSFAAADPASASFDAGSSGSWTWTRSASGLSDGTFYYRFTFTDLAGNSSQATKVVNLDTQDPVLSFSSATPSIDFNGTTQTATGNGLMALTGTVTEEQGVANLQILRYRVDSGGWNNLTLSNSFSLSGINTTGAYPSGTVTVDVEAQDRNGNSATETFTFNVDEASDKPVLAVTAPANGASITLMSISISGSVTDDDGIPDATGSVQYRYSDTGLEGGYGSWTDVPEANLGGTETNRSYSLSINSGSDGTKLLQIRAYDSYGVVSDSVTRTFSVDTGAPQFTGVLPADNTYHNGNIALSGTVTDNTSVVSLRYRVERNSIQIQDWTTMAGTPSASISFNETIDTTAGSGSYEIFLEASDGIYTRARSVRVYVDRGIPSVAFNALAASPAPNNNITISGTRSDNYGFADMYFRVLDFNAGDTPRELPSGILTAGDTWTITGFDTRSSTLLSYAEALGGDVYEITIRAYVNDVAGNSYDTSDGNDLIFQISQEDDRPDLTLDGIALDGSSYLSSTIITGSVQDDDGIAQILVDTWDVGNSTGTPSRSETVILTSGTYGSKNISWRVTLANNGNGLRGIRVRVIDSVDNNGQDYGASDYSRYDSARIDFNLDTENPENAMSTPLANITWSSNNSFDVGGTAEDETGIVELAYKIDDNDFASGATTFWTGSSVSESWSFTLDQGALSNGSHTIYVRAEDTVGKATIASRLVNVDKTGPSITPISPLNGAAVFGPLTINGAAADNAGGAGVKNIKIGLGNQIDPGNLAGSTWIDIVATTSWSYSFTNINDYANPTYSVNTGDANGNGLVDGGETWTDLWNFTFYVRAEDNAGDGVAGNVEYLTSYVLQIDPKRDRPEVTIISPNDGATVGGFLRVFGSAFDSQNIEKVQIAIDSDSDGDYSTSDEALWAQGVTDEVDEGVQWYLVTGTDSWNVRLNEAGEFDPVGANTTNPISFKIRAKDYKLTPGDGIYGNEEECTVTFNKNYPQITGVNINSGDTIGGTRDLIGLVRDESDISRIVFSNEGPLLNSTVIFENPGDLVLGAANQDVSSAAAQALGIQVLFLGTDDDDYDAAFPGSYRVTVPINTEAAGLYPNGAGSMSVKLYTEDNTEPAFTNQYLISFSVDNINPSDLNYLGGSELVGAIAAIKGTVRDTGTVSGIKRVFAYITNADGDLVGLKGAIDGGTGDYYVMTSGSWDLNDLFDDENSAYENYRMIIDNRLEDGSDAGSAGDNDGFAEWLTLSGGVYNWEGRFDSNYVADGAVSIHLQVEDYADNMVTLTSASFIANNKPVINSVVLGTDLNGIGGITGDEHTDPITTGYTATGFVARGGLLYIGVNVSGGNPPLRYSVFHDGVERNLTLTGSTMTINTEGLTDSGEGVYNDKAFIIKVYDSTTSDDDDDTDELSATITVNVTINNVDGIVPSIDIAPFGERYTVDEDDAEKVLAAVSTYNDNILMNGSTRLGYVEYGADSTHNGTGTDADISGTVIFKGKVHDNQRIQKITATIPDFDGGAGNGTEFDIWTSSGGELSGSGWSMDLDGDNYLTSDYGQAFNWNFTWDSAGLSTGAADDVTITFTVYDFKAILPEATGTDTTSITVDVAPYVVKVETALSKLKKSNWSVFNRTALGHYPVDETETIIAYGFNLSGAIVGSTTPTVTNDGTYDKASIPMTDIPTAPLALTVSGVGILNNTNNNTVTHNQQPNGDNNNLLTDDVVLDVWETNSSAAMPRSGKVTDPVMKINPSTGLIGFAFANGPDSFSMGSGITNSYQWWQNNYDDFAGVSFAYDSNGISHGIAIGRDQNSGDGGYAGRMTYLTSKWGRSTYYNQTHDNFAASRKVRLESIGLPGGIYINGSTTANTDYMLDKNRLRSPSLAVAAHAAGEAVYLAYYDDLNGQIRFRYGTNDLANKTGQANFDQFIDAYGYSNGSTNAAYLGDCNTNNWSQHRVFETEVTSYSLIAGVQYNPRVANTLINDTGNTAGEYVAIDVIPGTDATDDVVVIVWYDGTDLKYIYRYGTKDDTDASSTAVADRWSAPMTVFEEMGRYCTITADANEGIHIAAYDNLGGDLKYAYLPSYDSSVDDLETCIVDSYGIVGNNITIDTALNGDDEAVPYISYYMPSTMKPKLAYLIDPASDRAPDGVNMDDDSYTGAWEISVVPTASELVEDRINVGVWKDSDTGERITNPLTGTSSSGLTGTCYGNNTANPVLGYAIAVGTGGAIETAQMK